MIRPSFRSRLSGCFLALAIAIALLGINYLITTRTCPSGELYELPSFATKKRVRCRNRIKITDYSADFVISPDDLDVLKRWQPFGPTVVWNQENGKEWRQNAVHSETEAQKTDLEKKAEELSSFWYRVYHPGDQFFEILIDTSDESEYIGYIEATFIQF